MAAPAQTTPVAAPRRRLVPRGLSRVVGPIREARGFPRAMLYIGAGITVAFVLIAILAPLISPYDFDQYQANGRRFPQLAAPSSEHLMGTTVQSTDVLSRVIWGAQTELKVVVISLVFAITVGVPLGLLSGYFGGKLDRGLVLVMDAMYAFPYLLLAIVIAFLLSDSLGKGVLTAAIAITAAYVPLYFRVVRNQVIALREESYVEAARALGAKPFTIIRKYVFHNVVQNVPPIATLNAADAILAADRARLSRVRDPADRCGRVGLRHLTRGLGYGLGDLVDRALPRHCDRSAGHRPDAARRGPERDDEPGAPPAPAREGRRSSRSPKPRSSRQWKDLERGRPSCPSATCASTTAPSAVRCAPSTASRSTSAPVRCSVSSASRGAASRRSAAACSACCRRAPPRTVRCCTAAGTSSGSRRRSSRGSADPSSA